MAGIGIKLPGITLSDDTEFLVLHGTEMDEGIDSQVVQRSFQDGEQRAFSGFSTYDPIKIMLTEFSAEDRDWIDRRSGGQVLYRNTIGQIFNVVVGNAKWKLRASESDDISYSASLQLFVQETE